MTVEISNENVSQIARQLVAELNEGPARVYAWSCVHERANIRDREGVEKWCRGIEALEEIDREPWKKLTAWSLKPRT